MTYRRRGVIVRDRGEHERAQAAGKDSRHRRTPLASRARVVNCQSPPATSGDGEALGRGYATSSTDTGHRGRKRSFVLGHPEKFIDFAYRAVHEMAVTAKAIVNAFYGSAPKIRMERVLGRRTPGSDRSAALPERLRRHDRGRAGQSTNTLDAWQLSLAQAALHGSGGVHPAREVSGDPPRGARRVRRARRRQGRPDRRSDAMQFRSAGPRVRNGDGRECLTARAGGDGANDHAPGEDVAR